MIALDQEFKELYNTYGGKDLRLVFRKKACKKLRPHAGLHPSYGLYPSQLTENIDDFVIGNDMIHTDSLEITESLCSDENLDFGACESAKMEIVVTANEYIRPLYPHNGLYPSSGLHPTGKLVGREFALIESIPGVGEITRGIFIVDSIPREDDRETRRIIAYDRMSLFDKDVADWYNSLTFPTTLKSLRGSLCSYVGVPEVPTTLINDEMRIGKTLSVDILNGRDLIRYICQINGVFGNINHNGEFRYVKVPAKDRITETITTYKSADSEEFIVPDINRVKIRKEEGDIGGTSGGSGDNFYILEGNILAYGKNTPELNTLAEKVRGVVSNLAYRPATIVGNSMPWLEMGDRLLIKTSDGDVNTILMYRTTSGIQGAMETIESTGTKELNQAFSVESQLIQARGLSAKLKIEAGEISSELKNLDERTTSRFTQTAEQIRLEVERASDAEGKLSSQITQTAEEIALKVSIGDVTKQLNSELKITGNSIALTTGHFTVDSKNFNLNEDGDATFSGKITGGSININNIFKVDKDGNTSITGNHFSWKATNSELKSDGTLTCGNLTATGGKIAGFKIQGSQLLGVDMGSEIKGGNLNTPSLLVEYGSDVLMSAVADSDEVYINTTEFFVDGINIIDEIDRLWKAVGSSSPCSREDCDSYDSCPNYGDSCSRYGSCTGESSCTCHGVECNEYGPGC